MNVKLLTFVYMDCTILCCHVYFVVCISNLTVSFLPKCLSELACLVHILHLYQCLAAFASLLVFYVPFLHLRPQCQFHALLPSP